VNARATTPPTDGQLIRAARGGDPTAFASLVRRYEETVYRFAFKMCRNRERAEETLQDTFINVFRKLDSFDGKSKFSTWLYTIVANNCLMRQRRRKLDELVDPLEEFDEPHALEKGQHRRQIPDGAETPDEMLLSKELRGLLDRAIERLPLDYRAVFILRDIEGHSNEETARILKISVEATKSRLRRARAFLRDQLHPYLAADRRTIA
jgi:RNA polymerase sigma-70 factor (ECF subfamily)